MLRLIMCATHLLIIGALNFKSLGPRESIPADLLTFSFVSIENTLVSSIGRIQNSSDGLSFAWVKFLSICKVFEYSVFSDKRDLDKSIKKSLNMLAISPSSFTVCPLL